MNTQRLARGLVTGLVISHLGCARKKSGDPPTPRPEPGASASAVSADSATPRPSASVASEATSDPTIPVLHATRLHTPEGAPDDMFAVEGALIVKQGKQVGRIRGEGVDWLSTKIPPGNPMFGDHLIRAVVGRWPDEIGVVYTNANGRALEPTYFPITGKGASFVAGGGGMHGNIVGVARIGDAWVVAATDFEKRAVINAVRGKLLRKLTTDADAGCKDGELSGKFGSDPVAAIEPIAFESTTEGTLVSLGNLCEKRGPVAEVWRDGSTSKIVPLPKSWAKLPYWGLQLLKGANDDLYAFDHSWDPVLRFHDGAFEELPALERMVDFIFVSPDGKLHAYDGQTIHRLDGTTWSPVATFASQETYQSLALQDGVVWASTGTAVYRTEEQSRLTPPKECATPFVSLFEEDRRDQPGYTYPVTRKKLAAFPQAADLGLVEFLWDHRQFVGATVKSRDEGEALVKFARDSMKDDDPHYVCYAPKVLRTFDLATGQ